MAVVGKVAAIGVDTTVGLAPKLNVPPALKSLVVFKIEVGCVAVAKKLEVAAG